MAGRGGSAFEKGGFFSGLETARGLPHSPQNLKPGGFSVPHCGQAGASFAPHWPQNFMLGGLSAPQVEQLTCPF